MIGVGDASRKHRSATGNGSIALPAILRARADPPTLLAMFAHPPRSVDASIAGPVAPASSLAPPDPIVAIGRVGAPPPPKPNRAD